MTVTGGSGSVFWIGRDEDRRVSIGPVRYALNEAAETGLVNRRAHDGPRIGSVACENLYLVDLPIRRDQGHPVAFLLWCRRRASKHQHRQHQASTHDASEQTMTTAQRATSDEGTTETAFVVV